MNYYTYRYNEITAEALREREDRIIEDARRELCWRHFVRRAYAAYWPMRTIKALQSSQDREAPCSSR